MVDYFVCRECGYPPEIACMYINSSSAMIEVKLAELKCTRGKSKANWRYIDRATLRTVKTDIPSIIPIQKCFSQRDMEKGISLIDFYEKQGRIYRKGEWIFEEEKSL